MTPEIENTEAPKKEEVKKVSPILYGKKTIAFPFVDRDLDHFVEIHRGDKNGMLANMCLRDLSHEEACAYVHMMVATNQIVIWTIMTKEGRNARRVGYCYLMDLSKYVCGIGGIMDIKFAKGLTKVLRRDKITFAEDAFRSVLDFCFNKINMVRVTSEVLDFNRRSMALNNKIGFRREGVMRKTFHLDGQFHDLHIYGILKEEFNGQGTEDAKV